MAGSRGTLGTLRSTVAVHHRLQNTKSKVKVLTFDPDQQQLKYKYFVTIVRILFLMTIFVHKMCIFYSSYLKSTLVTFALLAGHSDTCMGLSVEHRLAPVLKF